MREGAVNIVYGRELAAVIEETEAAEGQLTPNARPRSSPKRANAKSRSLREQFANPYVAERGYVDAAIQLPRDAPAHDCCAGNVGRQTR